MKNAIILHGYPEKDEYYADWYKGPGNDHWFPWLQAQLLKKDIYAEVPVMPRAYEPDYETWKRAIERCDRIDQETSIIGHSCGGGFWLRYLSENKHLRVGKVVLVAPWLDPQDELGNDFFKGFKLDPDLASRTKGLTIFASDDDDATVTQSIDTIKAQMNNLKVVDFHGYGHFCYEWNMKSEEFPELLKEILL